MSLLYSHHHSIHFPFSIVVADFLNKTVLSNSSQPPLFKKTVEFSVNSLDVSPFVSFSHRYPCLFLEFSHFKYSECF